MDLLCAWVVCLSFSFLSVWSFLLIHHGLGLKHQYSTPFSLTLLPFPSCVYFHTMGYDSCLIIDFFWVYSHAMRNSDSSSEYLAACFLHHLGLTISCGSLTSFGVLAVSILLGEKFAVDKQRADAELFFSLSDNMPHQKEIRPQQLLICPPGQTESK